MALAICEHDNRQPPTIVRLYAGKSEADLRAAGVAVAAHEREGMYVVEKGAGGKHLGRRTDRDMPAGKAGFRQFGTAGAFSQRPIALTID